MRDNRRKLQPMKIHEEILEFRSFVLLLSYTRSQRGKVERLGLDIRNMYAQACYGAVNMAGKTNGVPALMQVSDPKRRVNISALNVVITKA